MKIFNFFLACCVALQSLSFTSLSFASESDKCEALKIITDFAGPNFYATYRNQTYSQADREALAKLYAQFYPQEKLVDKNALAELFTKDIYACIKAGHISLSNQAFKGLAEEIKSVADATAYWTSDTLRAERANSVNLADTQVKLINTSERLFSLAPEEVQFLKKVAGDEEVYGSLARDAQKMLSLTDIVSKESKIINDINELGSKKHGNIETVINDLGSFQSQLKRNSMQLQVLDLDKLKYPIYNENLDKYYNGLIATDKEIDRILDELRQEKRNQERAMVEAQQEENRKKAEKEQAEAERRAQEKRAAVKEKCLGMVQEYGITSNEYDLRLDSGDNTTFGEFLCHAVAAGALKQYRRTGQGSGFCELTLVMPDFEVIKIGLVNSGGMVSLNKITAKGETRGASKLEAKTLLSALDMLFTMLDGF